MNNKDSKKGLKIIKPGFFSLIQDEGRVGSRKYGITISGVLDKHAYYWGNFLLKNDNNCASLELLWGGCEFKSQINTTIVATGADTEFFINNKKMPMWQVINICKNDILTFGRVLSGIRVYLSIAGGFLTDIYFNSRSANIREHLGDKLQESDTLICKEYKNYNKNDCIATPARYIPDYKKPLNLRILPTFSFNDFTATQKELFFKQEWEVSKLCDRVAYQLIGEDQIKNIPDNFISEPMIAGSVQITQDGTPIIMMNDSPTIGGYPKIGTVVSLDLAKLAQTTTNHKIHFQPMRIKESQQELSIFLQFFNRDIRVSQQ